MRLRTYFNRVYTILYAREEITIEFLRFHEMIPDSEGMLEGRLRFWDNSLLEYAS